MIGALPESLSVEGEDYPIRPDYRNVLQVFEVFSDPELSDHEKCIVVTYLIFECFSCPMDVVEAVQDGFNIEEAQKQIQWFISAGIPDGAVLENPVYDWKQDEQMIFSAVNKVAGRETREIGYMHWWTFLGYFREIGEGTFSYVTGIRHKLNRGKKLEKHEKEFVSRNKELVRLRKPKTKEELEEEAENEAILKDVLG